MTTPAHSGSPSVFFSSTVSPPFVEDDIAILGRHFPLDVHITSGIGAIANLLPGVLRNDISFTWFGSVYAAVTVFLARTFGRKSIVVVGGVDASREAAYNYGIWLSSWRARCVRYAYRHADRVLPVAPHLADAVRRLAEYEGTNIVVLHTGYDTNVWRPEGEKDPVVLTVATCQTETRWKIKGIDKLLLAARALPGVRFRVIGISRAMADRFASDVPANLEIVPHVPRSELVKEYQRAKVYCQPSYIEGLPNTLCEAMACGCFPVGTNVGGIPTAIGDTGILVPYGDHIALVSALRDALALPATAAQKARERIVQLFTVEQREKALVGIINDLIQ